MAQMHISREGNWGGKMFGSLQEAYDRLRAIVDSSYDGIYITDGNAVTLWVNRAYEDITGLRAEEVVGRSMWDLERDGIISKSGTLLALAQRAPVTLEQVFRTGCHALISSTPAFDDRGEISLVVTNVRDMTELRELQEKYRQTAALSQRYQSEAEYVRKQVLASADLIVADPKMLSLLEQVKRVAALDATVLLLGETGVGKEKIAKYIYKNSARKDERFLAINCGAISPTLIESELFGYERGAFTGASREGKMGLFEVADKGTVFLDEIGELPLEMQVRLLRVLQEQTVQRVGAPGTFPSACGWWRPPTGTWRRWCGRRPSGRTCSTASTWCPSASPLCGSGRPISPPLWTTFWPSSTRSTTPVRSSTGTPSGPCWPTGGRATCGS